MTACSNSTDLVKPHLRAQWKPTKIQTKVYLNEEHGRWKTRDLLWAFVAQIYASCIIMLSTWILLLPFIQLRYWGYYDHFPNILRPNERRCLITQEVLLLWQTLIKCKMAWSYRVMKLTLDLRSFAKRTSLWLSTILPGSIFYGQIPLSRARSCNLHFILGFQTWSSSYLTNGLKTSTSMQWIFFHPKI